MKKFLYILKLENDYYYVGITEDIDHRYNSHASGKGSKWTQLHKPLSKDEMIILEIGRNKQNPYNLVDVDESTVTYHLMIEKGVDKVRGGGWCQHNLSKLPRQPKNFKYKENIL